MSKKKPYFHNNVDAIRQAPAEWFESIPYDDFMDWKTGGWELPSSVNCIIRERDLETGKVTEYVYKRSSAARKRLAIQMQKGTSEFTVCDAQAIHLLSPQEDYDDPLA